MATPNDHELGQPQTETSDLRSFFEKAGAGLGGIRGGLLLAAQNGFSARDVEIAADRIDVIEAEAVASGLDAVRGSAECLRALVRDGKYDANSALDVVASIEATLLQLSLRSGDFLADVHDLVESSFGHLAAAASQPQVDTARSEDSWDGLEIDDETLEIFQDEASSLLANIRTNIQALAELPGDTNALWEIRRNAHTFKGAAGIVGMKRASALAHHVEDLLDKMVESRRPADMGIVELLSGATDALESLTSDSEDLGLATALAADLEKALESLSSTADRSVSSSAPYDNAQARTAQPIPAASTPIVRVSLDRLDELIKLARLLTQEGTEFAGGLKTEMLRRLQQLRMVRFGTVETRLARAVHVTCQEENKRAELLLDGADVEVDTQIIDALVEPLIHLLKNAVVHGIESGEVRRLLCKPEKGRISLCVAADESKVDLTIDDDGNGIAVEKLLQKAIDNGSVTLEAAKAMHERDVAELIFHRGVTTASTLNMNAGRGVGMSIVRQCIEDRGGTVAVSSEPQKGTTFHITIPIIQPVKEEPAVSPDPDAALVLVVDDSESIRRQLGRFIEAAGVTAITAVDAAEALELLLNGLEPDLILSDVEMPNMNGWEFLEYVKTDINFGHVPVVMVTSLDAERYRDLAARLGASDYIVKPFGAKDLERVLDKFCSVAA